LAYAVLIIDQHKTVGWVWDKIA